MSCTSSGLERNTQNGSIDLIAYFLLVSSYTEATESLCNNLKLKIYLSMVNN